MPRAERSFDRARGKQIERMEGIARLEAIADEMWGAPVPRGPGTRIGGSALVFGREAAVANHTTRLAKLLEVTERHVRRIRATGIVPAKLLGRLTAEWRLWRRRQSDLFVSNRRTARKAEIAARVRALRGEDAD